jgi:hypothetical protein
MPAARSPQGIPAPTRTDCPAKNPCYLSREIAFMNMIADKAERAVKQGMREADDFL